MHLISDNTSVENVIGIFKVLELKVVLLFSL